jgi:hypothetical protein
MEKGYSIKRRFFANAVGSVGALVIIADCESSWIPTALQTSVLIAGAAALGAGVFSLAKRPVLGAILGAIGCGTLVWIAPIAADAFK